MVSLSKLKECTNFGLDLFDARQDSITDQYATLLRFLEIKGFKMLDSEYNEI